MTKEGRYARVSAKEQNYSLQNHIVCKCYIQTETKTDASFESIQTGSVKVVAKIYVLERWSERKVQVHMYCNEQVAKPFAYSAFTLVHSIKHHKR